MQMKFCFISVWTNNICSAALKASCISSNNNAYHSDHKCTQQVYYWLTLADIFETANWNFSLVLEQAT
jgi:hypothetical protein